MTAAAAAGAPSVDLARSTVAMTAITLLSRLTGFVRILVVAAVLGTTFLGNTYQSANTIPNLLFELFAAGVLQAVLIPSLVELLDQGDEAEAQHVTGSVLGLAGAGLAVLAGIGALAAPWVMRVLVSGVASPEVREAQIRLGTILLWFFLPQVVLYAAGMVATGVLNARGRFSLPVFAPAVNNVVVTASYGLFWYLRDGASPSLDLTGAQILVLGGGTTLGVLAFCAVPVIAVVRSGFSLRPRFDFRHPEVRRIARLGVWAAFLLAGTQVLMAVVLVLSNRVEGGVVAYQVAFTFFLLPHALFALPVLTALFPMLARHTSTGDDAAFSRAVGSGVRVIAYLVLPATAFFVAMAGPLSDAFLFGEITGDGARQVAGSVAAFAPGLLGYGAFLFLARAFYARGDTRTPALVGAAVVVGGAVMMVASFNLVPDDARVPALAGAHSVAYLAGSVAIFVLLRRRVPVGSPGPVVSSLAAGVASAALAGAAMVAAATVVEVGGRPGALLTLAFAGSVGLVVYVGAQAVVGRTPPRAVADMMRGR
ncbi:MAG TPA: murein biosynthesis integral membrane protein MurJ [Acidimicrobiales bacterium]|nr:murein biosynthesis integral membrane protein MurJ [Acidimicrobiales bacterium]